MPRRGLPLSGGGRYELRQIVGADHEFHDSAYAAAWAARFEPTPDRLKLFNLILVELQTRIPPHGAVVELGL